MNVKYVTGSSGTSEQSSGRSYFMESEPTKIVPGAVTFQNTEAMTRVSQLSSTCVSKICSGKLIL
jgi:hypothetical protein